MKKIVLVLLSILYLNSYAQNGYLNPQSFDYDVLYKEVLISLNKARVKNAKTKFTFSESLNKAALLHSEQMIEHSFFSHVNKKNKAFESLLDRVFYTEGNYPFLAENIADIVLLNVADNQRMSLKIENDSILYSLSDGTKINYHSYRSLADKIVSTWMNSPGHRKNILNSDLSETGLGALIHSRGEGIQKQYYILITQTLGGL